KAPKKKNGKPADRCNKADLQAGASRSNPTQHRRHESHRPRDCRGSAYEHAPQSRKCNRGEMVRAAKRMCEASNKRTCRSRRMCEGRRRKDAEQDDKKRETTHLPPPIEWDCAPGRALSRPEMWLQPESRESSPECRP